MNHVFRCRLYPTKRQQALLTEMLRDRCAMYNAALQERKDVYERSGVSVSYVMQCR